MSAWIVPKVHIDAMVTAWVELGGPRNALACNERGRILWEHNHRSVDHRYDSREPAKGAACAVASATIAEYEWKRVPWPPRVTPETFARLGKLINCYVYQSCEHPEWEGSEARRMCDELRSLALRALPGYEKAPWGATTADYFIAVNKGE